jgi:hypothetical protein
LKIETQLKNNTHASLIRRESYNVRSMRARRFSNEETVTAGTTFSGKLFHRLTIRLVILSAVNITLELVQFESMTTSARVGIELGNI